MARGASSGNKKKSKIASAGPSARDASPSPAGAVSVGTAAEGYAPFISVKRRRELGIVTIVLFPFICWVMKRTHDIMMERQENAPKGHRFASYEELFRVVPAATALICFLRYALGIGAFEPLGRLILSKAKRAQPDRVNRFAATCFKFCYMSSIVAWGFHILLDAPWFPAELGGKGDVKKCWFNGSPYQSQMPNQQFYYLIQLSYHLHSLVFQIYLSHREDFWEMALHHTVTIALIFGSYVMGEQRVGTLVLIVHDIGDVTSYLVKFMVDTDFTKTTLSFYGLLLATWGYTRLYVYPAVIIATISNDAPESCVGGNTNITIFKGLLWCLFGLHCYWYTLFLAMGYHYIIKKKTKDLQDCIDTDSDNDAKRSRRRTTTNNNTALVDSGRGSRNARISARKSK